MIQKEDAFQATKATFFYATTPLRFSFDCFVLKYSGEIFSQTIISWFDSYFNPPQEQNFADVLAMIVLAPLILIVSIQMAALQTIPYVIGELAIGALTVAPALVIAIAALPIMALLALGESICSLFSEPNLDYNDTHELSV